MRPFGSKQEERRLNSLVARRLAVLSGRKEPPAGRPTPDTVEDLEGCFDILTGVAVMGKRVLE